MIVSHRFMFVGLIKMCNALLLNSKLAAPDTCFSFFNLLTRFIKIVVQKRCGNDINTSDNLP